MNIVWLSWKDRGHPLAGGAEKVSGEIMDRLAADGHSVRLITAQYGQTASHEQFAPNFEIYRAGNRYTVYPKARQLFKQVGDDWADVVIDEMNTIPFGAGFYAKKSTNILLSYQLAREVWFHQMVFPLSLVGYLLEPLMLRVLARGNYRRIATESNSSKVDMERYGLKNIQTFRVGIPTTPLAELPSKDAPTIVLSLGALRPMKRTLDAVKAFEVAHAKDPRLQLMIAGDTSSAYAHKVIDYVHNSPHNQSITVLGRVSNEEREELMQKAAVILVTSIKEGWGLIVTEANSQGAPAIVYDVDGLRDSVVADKTGIVVPNNDYAAMGNAINTLLASPARYTDYRHQAWEMSKEYNFDNSYRDFMNIVNEANDYDKK